jgi:hypothetical protein
MKLGNIIFFVCNVKAQKRSANTMRTKNAMDKIIITLPIASNIKLSLIKKA